MIHGTERVAGGDVLQADCRGNVARPNFLDLVALVRVHLHHTADALPLALDRVVDLVARTQHARVDPEERQGADEGVGRDLEGQSSEGSAVVHDPGFHGFAVLEHTFDRLYFGRRRQVLDHGVQHGLNAFVLERGTAQSRNDLVGQRPHAQALLDVFLGKVAFLEVLFHQLFVGFCRTLDHLLAPVLGFFPHVFGNFAKVIAQALVLFVPEDGLHPDQIDDAPELLLGTERQLHWNGVSTETLLDLLDHTQKIRAGPVHLVDEHDPRNFVAVRLPPDRLALRLDA